MTRRSRLAELAVVLMVAAAIISSVPRDPDRDASAGSSTSATPPTGTPQPCPVTVPNGSTPPLEVEDRFHHGNGELWTDLPWPEGTIVVSPDHIGHDGWFWMKKGWWRAERGGKLTIEGRRLDAPALPLAAEIAAGYDHSHFQATGVGFPTEGCWEITGRVGEASLTVVVLVVWPDSQPATPTAAPTPGTASRSWNRSGCGAARDP